MPISPEPIMREFPGFDRIHLFREIQRRIPWARDASHGCDECPSLRAPGAILWIRPSDYDVFDEDLKSPSIVIEFYTPDKECKIGHLSTDSIDLAQSSVLSHLLMLSLLGQLGK